MAAISLFIQSHKPYHDNIMYYILGGYLAHSLAIMTDAAHMLSDFAAFLISLFAIWVAKWQPDKKRTFGYYRAGDLYYIIGMMKILGERKHPIYIGFLATRRAMQNL